MIRCLFALCAVAIGLSVMAEDANAQLFRRGGGCNSGCGGGGCNISAAPQTRATADDLLQQTTLRVPVKSIAPVAEFKLAPLKIDSKAALAFCAPVAERKHRLDLEKIVYQPVTKAPLSAVASR